MLWVFLCLVSGAVLIPSGFFLLVFGFFVRVAGAGIQCGCLLFVLFCLCVFVFSYFLSCLCLLLSLIGSLKHFLIYKKKKKDFYFVLSS